MKRIVAFLMLFVMIFTVCACGKKEPTTPEEKYVFESDKTQKVFKSGNNYMIFYYDKESKITGIDTVMTFKTEQTAKSSYEVIKKTEDANTGEFVLEGKYIVMHMSENYIADYLNMTEEVLESYLKGQGYVSVEKIEDDAETTTKKPETTAKKEETKTEKPAETTAKAK